MKREDMVKVLKEGNAVVTFTKADGTERVMLCTLREEMLPEATESKRKKPNDEVISVWDLDKLAWRAFRVDSVTDFVEA